MWVDSNTSANKNSKHKASSTVTENEVNELILIQQSTKTGTIYTLWTIFNFVYLLQINDSLF